ncbi:Phosphatidylglycerol lysyltransferase [Nocardioides aquaticus]|uniref:Phosphatidylglycerol lysyltransferase n=1 Tax=Nocardioides aquaticus TaxID=160826 RepID=A0ABX8EGZ7_9ACTN|nr:lysylphosphatidylglycerol synthase transmembrane domain-containing protein [Nocardioides aquaticus]QVT79800.1 Phosphatidylglycerol lysyltransferase [Nocardioides aquaticus]
MRDLVVEAPVRPVPLAPTEGFHGWRWLRRGGLLLLTVVVVEYLVLPQLVAARAEVSLIRSATPWLLGVAVALEAVSLLCFTLLSRATLPGRSRPHFWTLLRIDLSGFGLSHVLPGGGATAAALRYRMLHRAGVSAGDAVTGATVQTVGAIAALVVLMVTGVVLSRPAILSGGSLHGATALALVLLVGLGAGGLLLTRFRPGTLRTVHHLTRHLPRVRAAAVEGMLDGLGDRLRALVRDPRLLARTLGWAGANWALDAACLWVCLAAYGSAVQPGPLLALYAAVNLLAIVPSTPGGLGIVEAVLVPGLISVGVPAATALLGVLTWRLWQYWLPIPVGLAAYASLNVRGSVDRWCRHTPQR